MKFLKSFNLKKPSFKLNKNSFWLILLLIFLLLILGLQIIFKDYFASLYTNNPLLKKSTAEVYATFDESLKRDRVNLKFNLTEKDRVIAKNFFERAFERDISEEELSISLDNTTTEKAKKLLPVTLNLDFTDDSLSFNSSRLPTLLSSEVKSDFEFATESAKLNLRVNNERDFFMEAIEPRSLINYATTSGQTFVSPKAADSMFKVLENIAKISIRVESSNIVGEIRLK